MIWTSPRLLKGKIREIEGERGSGKDRGSGRERGGGDNEREREKLTKKKKEKEVKEGREDGREWKWKSRKKVNKIHYNVCSQMNDTDVSFNIINTCTFQ